MSSRILTFSGVVAVVLATSAVAGAYGAATPPSYPVAHDHRMAGLRLPKQLKVLWKQEEHGRLKAMPKDRRRGWIKTQWAAMSDQQKQVKLAELQKKWDSLPVNVRQRLLERKQEKREARRMQREQGGVVRSNSSGQMQQQ